MKVSIRHRRSRLALLVVGVVLFGFWRIVQRRKADTADTVTYREGPCIYDDWSEFWRKSEKPVKHYADFVHPLFGRISRATQRWEDVVI